MNTNIRLKISYRGVIDYITSSDEIKYKDVINMAMKNFNISRKLRKLIEIEDDAGHVFDKESFEQYIRIFPKSDRILYLSTTSQVVYTGSAEIKLPRYTAGQIIDKEKWSIFQKSTNMTKKREVQLNEAAPLVRQNCFIGTYPTPLPQRPNRLKMKEHFNRILIGYNRRIKKYKHARLLN